MLDAVVGDDEFVGMVSAANRLRDEVGAIGVGGSDIDHYVRARLYWNPKLPALAEGHEALANEIVVVLGDSRLSSAQMAELERAYFPPRGRY